MSCPECGGSLELPVEPGNIIIRPEPATIKVEVGRIGTVVETPVDHPHGRHVDYRPSTGGQSVSSTTAKGDFDARLSGPLVVGRDGEPRAIEVLAHALSTEGRRVTVKPRDPKRDAHGEDGRLVTDGHETVVQVVTLPRDTELWRQVHAEGRVASHSGDLHAAVALVRAAVERKRHAEGDIVVLDAAYFGALAWRKLVDAYLVEHGDPTAEFGFADAWIIGPTIRSSIRLRA